MKSTCAFLLLGLLSVMLGCAGSDESGCSGGGAVPTSGKSAEEGQLAGEEMSAAYPSNGQEEGAQPHNEDTEETAQLASKGMSRAYSSKGQEAGDAAASTPQIEIIVDDPSVTVVRRPLPPATPPSGPGPWVVNEGGPPSISVGSDEIGATERDEPEAADVPSWPVYTDQTCDFGISHPPYYVVETLDATTFDGSAPVPLFAVHFQDEEVAESDTADLALPAFSIRVYENKTEEPLKEWLASAGLVKAGQYTEPYKGSHESGISVYSRHYMAPGWFVYVAGDGVVYQLTPLGPTGELMLDTFDITN